MVMVAKKAVTPSAGSGDPLSFQNIDAIYGTEEDDSDGGIDLGCGGWTLNPLQGTINGACTAIEFAVNHLPGVDTAISLLEGCLENVTDFFTGIISLGGEAWEAATNTDEWLQGKIELFESLMAAIEEDPEAFVVEFLLEFVEAGLLDEDPAKWVGKIGCQVAVAVLSGGGPLGSHLANKADDILDWVDTRRDGRSDGNDNGDADVDADSDRDGDGINCGIGGNSFPTGTDVLMANGSHRAIDQIRPGDYVLAADTTTGAWTPREVLDQWSHLDDGYMATVTLTDGSSVTATDHHEFWVASDGAWLELDQVRPGDLLLAPEGVSQVADVEITEQEETLVWELDTAIDDTFTVHTGTTNLLVHNQDTGDCGSSPGSDAHREEQWEAARDSGMTRAEFDQRYDELGLNVSTIPDGVDPVGFDPVTGQPVTYVGPDGRLVDIRTPEQIQIRGQEILGDAGDRTVALGRQVDTDLAPGQGDFHLAVTDWSQEVNDAFIDEIIDNGTPIRVVSNPRLDENIFRAPGERTVFGIEIEQLEDAGIEIVYDGYP